MLNWAIIGCGDVVQRLVQDSLFSKNKSTVIYVLTENFKEAEDYAKKYNIEHVLKKTKKNRRNWCYKSNRIVIKRKKRQKRLHFWLHHTKDRCNFGCFLAQTVKQPSALSQISTKKY